jgi:hypothetical protein
MARTAEQKLEIVRVRAFSKIFWGERNTEAFRFPRYEGLDDAMVVGKTSGSAFRD